MKKNIAQMKNHENSELKKEIEEIKSANVLLPKTTSKTYFAIVPS